MCLEDIFRNNVGYSHVLYCFFRQCVSALCTVAVVFFFFDFCLLLQIAHLPLNFCVPGDQVSPTRRKERVHGVIQFKKRWQTQFYGKNSRLGNHAFYFYFQLISSPCLSFCVFSSLVVLPYFSEQLSHFTVKDTVFQREKKQFQYSPFEMRFGNHIDKSHTNMCFVSVGVCLTTSSDQETCPVSRKRCQV